MTLVTPEPTINRDRYGRPLVTPPDGGKPVPYTRATTFIDCIEDKYNLQRWMLRMTALGLAARPDLMLSVSAHRDDKRALDRICEDAKEAAAASAAATTGTALHALTELVDRGQDLPVLPDAAKADLAAYAETTDILKATHIEQFCVLDTLKIGGTPDRVVEFKGERYIADIKTGSVEWGALKIAAQLAVYARSHTYDVATGKRGRHDASTTRGIVIHLPAGEARCELLWIDLEAGWQAVQVAKQVREQRALKFADLTAPLVPDAKVQPSLRLEKRGETATLLEASVNEAGLVKQIKACTTPEMVRAVWESHQKAWNDRLTEAAKARIAELPTAS